MVAVAVVTRAGRRRAGDAAVQPRFELTVVADASAETCFRVRCGVCARRRRVREFRSCAPRKYRSTYSISPRPRFTPSRAGRAAVARALGGGALSVSAVSAGAKRGGWFVYVVETKSGKLYSGITVAM